MRSEVILGKCFKKLATKYRKQGLYLYWSWIRTRFLKNVAIKAHKEDKPKALKNKYFRAIKTIYLKKKLMRSKAQIATNHHREYHVKKSLMKLINYMKTKQYYADLGNKAERHYRINNLLNKTFLRLKDKWSKAKHLTDCLILCREKLASITLKRSFVTFKSKTQAKRLLEAASVYYKRH
jgi:hypothetical protein